jgi:hypothetical protein
MRPLPTVTLLLLMLTAGPALAQSGLDNMGSEQQTEGYGKLFGYVCAVVALGAIIFGGVQIAKGMMAEGARGKKVKVFTDILDEDEIKKKRREIPLYLGEKVPDWKVKNRLAATKAALKFLGKTDDWWDPKLMAEFARAAFLTVKEGITDRATKKLARRLTDKCLEEIQAEVRKLKKKGELHVLDKMQIEDVQMVHFEAPAGKTNHTFTALISASSRDFFKDDKSGELLRGNKKLYEYQEFWRFRRTKDMWLVERIRPAGDMDMVLEPKNVMTPADLDAFTKDADPEHLREFAAK